jgi:hypothetical protein
MVPKFILQLQARAHRFMWKLYNSYRRHTDSCGSPITHTEDPQIRVEPLKLIQKAHRFMWSLYNLYRRPTDSCGASITYTEDPQMRVEAL